MKILSVLVLLGIGIAVSYGSVIPDLIFDSRVVGGDDAPVGIAPYQVSLRDGYYKSHFCGGAILNERWVLSAGHCLTGQASKSITVVTGTNQLSKGGDFYVGDKIVMHPGYNPRTIENDLALLRVKESIKFSKLVQPISMYGTTLTSGLDLTLTGWGRTSYPGVLPNNLQILSVKSVEVSHCRSLLSTINQVFDSQVCALSTEGEGACHGDSGGPLAHNGELVGIVSWGVPCAKGFPDVYSSTYAFRDWIQSFVKEGFMPYNQYSIEFLNKEESGFNVEQLML